MAPPTVGPFINPSTVTPNLDIPPVAIILIITGGWIVILTLILIIRQVLLSRGICRDIFCGCCGRDDDPRCCECCVALSDACTCRTPTIDQCLDSCCPKRNLDCVGFLLCQCCGTQNATGGCNDPNNPCCSCGDLNFNCACVQPDFNQVNCLCCQIGTTNYARQDD